MSKTIGDQALKGLIKGIEAKEIDKRVRGEAARIAAEVTKNLLATQEPAPETGLMPLTRNEAADILKRYISDKTIKTEVPALHDALLMAVKALLPWVRTAERKPTLADANKDGCVYAYDVNGYKQIDGQIGKPGIRVMHYQTVRIHHASFLWWSSIPPLPEVEP